MKKAGRTLFFFTVAAMFLAGCGKKADTTKPVEQIKSEVQNMTVNDLEANAKAYAREIAAKRVVVEKIAQEIKAFSVKDLMGEKANVIKEKISKIDAEVSALTERYQVYFDKYREKGGDISRIQISQA